MPKLTIQDLNVAGKRVLVRVDFNVPLKEENGQRVITDTTRVDGALKTIKFLVDAGAKVVLMSHLGRPKGERVEKYSLAPVAVKLSEILGSEVVFAADCIGEPAESAVAALADGGVVLLENLRFHAEEEANDSGFAEKLAKLADIYVNDAFGTAHRAHASTAGVVAFVDQAAAGFLMQRELKYLQDELAAPARPFTVILGGAKVSDKIQVITALLDKADQFIIGGAMANTFLKALGHEMGDSLLEADKAGLALEILKKAKEKGVDFLIPLDTRVTQEFKAGAATKTSGLYSEGGSVPAGWEGIDIGDHTIEKFVDAIKTSKTIVWNGPMGVFEIPEFAIGTEAVARAVAESDAVSIIGGGDSVTAINKFGLADEVTFISTGGGASLELLEGKELPGVAALSDVHI